MNIYTPKSPNAFRYKSKPKQCIRVVGFDPPGPTTLALYDVTKAFRSKPMSQRDSEVTILIGRDQAVSFKNELERRLKDYYLMAMKRKQKP